MSRDPSRLDVYCLDVGQGDCSVILPPDGEGDPILFDCADSYVAERFFLNHGVNRLEAVVVSHLDVDHIRGVLPFLKTFFAGGGKVHQLVLGIDRDEPGDAATELIGAALRWANDLAPDGFQLFAPFREAGPRRIASGNGWDVDLVLPHYPTTMGVQLAGNQPNRGSAVLRVSRGSAVVLLGGDAELGSWERLEPSLRPARLIRTPHHGGDILNGAVTWKNFGDLYDAVQADHAVISVGTKNRHGHPVPDHLTAARRGGQCRVLCTQLTPQCHSDVSSVRDPHGLATSIEYPYRHLAVRGHPSTRPRAEVPCAGTVLVSMDQHGAITVSPTPKRHGDFLALLNTPMCR
ncbi:MAG: MBL fold metallo-hydrolase [Polyangiales bacterium]